MAMRPVHVLLAEDEKHTQFALSLILRKAGYLVTTVSDGLAALKKVTELQHGDHEIDALVVDIQMPGLTGLDLLEELERREVPLPTLIISGYQYRRLLDSFGQKGRFAYLEKPFEPEEFLRQVRRVLKTCDSNGAMPKRSNLRSQ